MTACLECLRRAELLAEAEFKLRDKRFKYGDKPYYMLPRLLGSYEHATRQAKENLEHHKAECTEEKL